MEEELDRLQKQGILEPTQHAEMATPLVWLRKKDGTFRVCGDYRSTVNAVVKKTAYPLPKTEEVFAKLRGGTTFSTLDLYKAYQQLRVDDETAELLTVNTTKGLFKGVHTTEEKVKTILEAPKPTDNDIERVVKSCATCCQHQETPTKAPAPEWKRATTPWHRIYADFAGPVEGKMLLL
ncbi:uncharacterized protein K02A2.6-like [Rhipicephalus sanguineus]|uniref:uncharacterized protein K02A2.6-like n=1 Tax=Rhipicephalus sanguineus TaxID=34632 RepID=UPI0020C358AD|nr:uncharacterized protein K02A2.6-like [Rhipicephalus sanguineus]